jgi:hypothetical protein
MKEEQILGLSQGRWTRILHLLKRSNHGWRQWSMYTTEIDERSFYVVATHDGVGTKERMI